MTARVVVSVHKANGQAVTVVVEETPLSARYDQLSLACTESEP